MAKNNNKATQETVWKFSELGLQGSPVEYRYLNMKKCLSASFSFSIPLKSVGSNHVAPHWNHWMCEKKKKKKVETLFKIIFYMRVPQGKKSNAGLDQHEGVYMMKEL